MPTMRAVFGLMAALSVCSPLPAQNPQASKQMRDWVDPARSEPSGTRYKLFHSKILNGDYSYLVYLPPDYDSAPQKRYPSVYWLHRFDGNQRDGGRFAQLLDSAIRRGKAPAMIVFLLNGLGESCWVDSKDGKYPVDSIITKEMVPYFDQTYRTIPRREARAVEGMSMGGYGALRLGFSHNDLFGVVSALAPGLISEKDQPPQRIPPDLFERVMGSDLEYFRANTAWTAAERNADKIGKNTLIRIVVGDKDTVNYERCQAYRDLLNNLQVPFQFVVVPGVKHSYPELYATLGDEAFVFYVRAMGRFSGGGVPNVQAL